VPGRVVRLRDENGLLEHGKLPDPEGQALEELTHRVAELEAMLRKIIAEHDTERQSGERQTSA
jgi:hypothetical protein